MSVVTLGRWGKSLAVRLPSELVGSFPWVEGERVEVERRADEIVIRRALPPLTLDDLFRGKTPAEWRALYRDHGAEWGPDVGREIIED